MNLTVLEAEALRLAPDERAALVEVLWESLEQDALLTRRQRWMEETEMRIDAFDRGELNAIDGPTAIKDLRRSLRR